MLSILLLNICIAVVFLQFTSFSECLYMQMKKEYRTIFFKYFENLFKYFMYMKSSKDHVTNILNKYVFYLLCKDFLEYHVINVYIFECIDNNLKLEF